MARRRNESPQAVDGIRRTSRTPVKDAAADHRAWRRRVRWRWVLAICLVVVIVGTWVLMPVATLARTLLPLWRPGAYLVLLENDAELRPTGGFIGSYAVVHVYSNRLPDIRIETNIYKVDNAFTTTNAITPPVPMQGITDRWALRDSNWDIDFPTAAKTISWFFEQETGETVNGVIGVTAQAGKNLLGVTGPVQLSDGTALADNGTFYNTLAYKVEKQYFVDPANRAVNEPKTLLNDLVPQLVQRLRSPVIDLGVITWLKDMLATKQLVMTFFDDRQAAVDAHGWSDRIDTTAQQYFSVNNANLGGMKSSQYLTESQQLAITTKSAVSATYQVTIIRTHHGNGAWPDHRNDNLTRLVLPSGATLLEAQLDGVAAVPATTESIGERTAIGFRIDTEPGTSQTLTAKFTVPIDPTKRAELAWQKQPGITSDAVAVSFNGVTLLQGQLDRDRTISLPR